MKYQIEYQLKFQPQVTVNGVVKLAQKTKTNTTRKGDDSQAN